MAGKPWTTKETEVLTKNMTDGLKKGISETYLLQKISKSLGRTLIATRLTWYRIKLENPEIVEKDASAGEERNHETAEADIGRDYINIVVASRRITSVDAALSHFGINMNEWEIERQRVKTSEGYRKDRKVEWEVEDGKVTKGKVDDSGKMLVVPMYHIQITLKRKTSEIRARLAIDDMLADARKQALKVKAPKYGKLPKGLWYEVDFPDVHFGKETWTEESGQDYNVEIARRVVLSSLDRLLGYARPHGVEQIILPMGNDFFNVDNKENTTTHGTPQQEDTRWQRTFRLGRQLAEAMIEQCAQLAPVKVVMVAGNHDEQRTFYLGEVLEARYGNTKHITVDNRAMKRKYVHFGSNLIGFTHGYWEKITKLPSIMPIEAKHEWAASTHREFHLGDKHHKKDMLHRTEDMDGVTVRILRSLSATDTWHYDKGYVGTPRSAEAFLWDKTDGVVAQFQAILTK